MSEINKEISRILLNCEAEGTAPKYIKENISFGSNGKNIFVISDLHIAEGRGDEGNYTGTENFFYDDSFHRFIKNTLNKIPVGEGILIINGDFIDFLRITSFPQSEDEFKEWQLVLDPIGISKSIEELKSSVIKKEIKYGLKTNDYKSVWKLSRVQKGHSKVFDALAEWLKVGNQLVFIKGNHDLELVWLAIRNYFRFTLAERISFITKENPLTELKKILPMIHFVDDSLLIDKDVFIEHGQKYDKYCKVIGDDLINNKTELNIPFGSFFNRYLLNRIELAFPFLDNIRPTVNILPLLFRERFFLGIRVLFQHIPFMIKIIPKRYYRYIFGRVLLLALAVFIPVIFVLINFWNILEPAFISIVTPSQPINIWEYLGQQAFSLVLNAIPIVFSFAFARIVAYFQLEEPSSLSEDARKIFAKNPDYRIITFGHTHNPDQFEENGKWFFNTGTWIPIIETSTVEIREDRTFTFLQLKHDSNGKLQPKVLQRWNDDSSRTDSLILVERKDG